MTTKKTPREFTRCETSMPVDLLLRDGTWFATGKSRNLSMNGVFIECRKQLEPGTVCSVEIRTHSSPPVCIVARGEVARVDEGGLAVQFNELPMECYDQLRNVVLYHAVDPSPVLEELGDRRK